VADDDPRTRILAATVGCIGGTGLAKTTMEDAARAAGVSRATVYRHFPGGRDQLIAETITWEVGRFFAELGRHVDDAPDFPARLERALVFAHRAVAEHAILQKVLDTEPDRLLPQLTLTGPLVLAVLRGYFEPLLEDEPLADGLSAEAAADWLARNVLSFIVAAGGWDLTDPAEVRRLVRTQLLAGVLAAPAASRPGP
jgi:AcrR family transcriptional regulator